MSIHTNIQLGFPEEIWKLLREIAKRENRSGRGLCREMIIEGLIRRGAVIDRAKLAA